MKKELDINKNPSSNNSISSYDDSVTPTVNQQLGGFGSGDTTATTTPTSNCCYTSDDLATPVVEVNDSVSYSIKSKNICPSVKVI